MQDLKHRTDISDEEREHRRKILMAEVAAGVVGTGVLGFAGYQAYQHFNKDDEDKAMEHPGEHPKVAWRTCQGNVLMCERSSFAGKLFKL